MRRWMHVFILLAVLLAFAASYTLLSGVIGSSSPWLVLLLMFYFLGLVKLAEPLFTLSMPSALHHLSPWEREGNIYRRLGVLRFGRVLRQTPLRYLNTAVYLTGKRESLLQVRARGESAEASHFWAAVLVLPYIALAAFRGRWDVVAWFSFAQLLVNVYPILHLRHMRGRLDKVLVRNRRHQAR